jgi:hypothetical protein
MNLDQKQVGRKIYKRILQVVSSFDMTYLCKNHKIEAIIFLKYFHRSEVLKLSKVYFLQKLDLH